MARSDRHFLFVDLTKSRKPTRLAKRHVMLEYLKRQGGAGGDLPQVPTPWPARRVIRFKNDVTCGTSSVSEPAVGKELTHDIIGPTLTFSTVGTNSFDPFNALAAHDSEDTLLILRSLYSPSNTDTVFESWVHQFFAHLSDRYWHIAMSDPVLYHLIGFQAYPTSAKRHFEHKISAYRGLALDVAIKEGEALLCSISLLLYLTAHGKEFAEAGGHLRAMIPLMTEDVQQNISPTVWFCIAMAPLNYCTATRTSPALPYYVPPALAHGLLDLAEDKYSGQARQILDSLPKSEFSIPLPALHTWLVRYLCLVPLSHTSRDYERILALYFDVKYDLCRLQAGADDGRSSAVQIQATDMVLTALHLNLWMLCSNRTRTQANAGAAEMILAVARAPLQVLSVLRKSPAGLVWILTACNAYARYTLRNSSLSAQLRSTLQSSLKAAGIHDFLTLRNLMDLFAGPNVWPDQVILSTSLL